jgi:hypothetical protein
MNRKKESDKFINHNKLQIEDDGTLKRQKKEKIDALNFANHDIDSKKSLLNDSENDNIEDVDP